jgi:serine/threonine-protein kinase RsbT
VNFYQKNKTHIKGESSYVEPSTEEDNGPGIANIEQAMEVGYTTSGGLGMGLAGAKRLMDEMEIRSEVGQGTAITVRKWRR